MTEGKWDKCTTTNTCTCPCIFSPVKNNFSDVGTMFASRCSCIYPIMKLKAYEFMCVHTHIKCSETTNG